jgi:AcrR family transcriptional regulator
MKSVLPRRQRGQAPLLIPPPSRKGNIKVTYDGWLAAARHLLIAGGIAAVKIDRLAKQLKVSRGSFYHYFKGHQQLLDALLLKWQREVRFSVEPEDIVNPQAAASALERTNMLLVTQFDDRFDTAVREWARISPKVDEVVHKVDEKRVQILYRTIKVLGYDEHEALIRARVFYYHQVGYYALGIAESAETRMKNLPMFVKVLFGENYLEAAKMNLERPQPAGEVPSPPHGIREAPLSKSAKYS